MRTDLGSALTIVETHERLPLGDPHPRSMPCVCGAVATGAALLLRLGRVLVRELWYRKRSAPRRAGGAHGTAT
jgi:hypothetical protein